MASQELLTQAGAAEAQSLPVSGRQLPEPRFRWGAEARKLKEAVIKGTNMRAIRELGPTRLSQDEQVLKDGQIVSLDGFST